MAAPRFLIEQPELRAARGLLPRQVMTYNIRVEGGDFPERGHHPSLLKAGVRKRFNDFVRLRKQLVARYGREGLLVPPLPPKHTGTQDADFVKRRMAGLALFLEGLASSPFFALDASVDRFVTTTTERDGTIGDGDDLDGSVGGGGSPSLSPSGRGSNRGYQLWHEHLAGAANPPQPDVLLGQVRTEVEVAERGVKEALGASKGLEHGFAHMASALQAFSQALHVAADGERGIAALNDTAAPGSAKGLESAAAAAEEEEGEKEKEKEEGRPSVPMLVTRTAALYSAISPGYAALQPQLSHLFGEALEYELAVLQALTALLQGQDALATRLVKLARKVHGLLAQPPHRRSAPQARAELEGLQAQLGREEVRLYKYTKAVLCFSVPGAARARAVCLRRAFGHLAAVTTAAAAVACNASLAYLGEVGMAPTDVVEAANDAAAALVLPPVPPIALPPSGARKSGGHRTAAGASKGAATTTSTAALAATKLDKPGSFLAEPAPIPSSSSSAAGEGQQQPAASVHNNNGASSVVLTLPVVTAPTPALASSVSGSGKAPWLSDDEVDDPFSPAAPTNKGKAMQAQGGKKEEKA